MGNYQTQARPEIKSTFTFEKRNGNNSPGNYVFYVLLDMEVTFSIR